jgi:hypothetical protein
MPAYYEVFEWLESSQENYDLFMFGLEGKKFVWDDDNAANPTASSPVDVYIGMAKKYSVI